MAHKECTLLRIVIFSEFITFIKFFYTSDRRTKMVSHHCVVFVLILHISNSFSSLHCGFEAWSSDTLKCQTIGAHKNYITQGSNSLSMLNQYDWSGIKTLILKDAKIADIEPNLFAHASSLINLDLSGNKELIIPDDAFNHMRNLQTLNISGLQVNFQRISNLRNLRNLCISHSGMTTNDPQFVAMMNALTNLEVIDLSNNLLIDFTILHIGRSLRTIDASNCEVILADGCFANASNLKTLLLSPSAVKTVPENTFYGTTIEHVNLADNYINEDTLPSLTPSMKYVYLDRNQIDGIYKPWKLYNVRILDLSQNRIAYLFPQLFWQTIHLIDLNLSDNRLSSLSSQLFSRITTLQILNLSNNRLTQLPDALLNENRDLNVLLLRGNKLKTLSPNLLQNIIDLTTLGLSNNLIERLPSQLYLHLQKLQKLDLNMNPLSEFPAKILQLQSLRELGIICGRLANLPEDFSSLVRMNTQLEIALHGNPWRCGCLSRVTDALENNRYAQDDFNSGTYPSCFAGIIPSSQCSDEPLSEEEVQQWQQALAVSGAGC